ncbi:MAG TPA: patatin-like phospholipase family protein [Thermoanaerobaculia bacterium]|nr:patatin-like phospholipase family protein [Thermoanaerobaculia bacterium]
MGDGGGGNGRGSKVALALAGGGLAGAIYEIGALRALDEALDGFDFNQAFLYVGVSAGAFLNACLANDLTTAQMCRAIVSTEPGEHPFVAETFLTPTFKRLAGSASALPRLLFEALRDYTARPAEKSLLGSLTRLSRLLPVAWFDNEPMRAYLERIYGIKNRTDDFRQLGKRLIVVATDLDSGRAVRFGEPGLDHVPISRAVQASSALPGFYPPVEIDGHRYVDGILIKTVHASVALEAGAELVLCLNPLVPVDMELARGAGYAGGTLVDQGLPTVLSQAVRTLVHSRLEVGMSAYGRKFAGADVVLFEPQPEDHRMFFTNIFGFSERRTVVEHAYRSTRRELLRRAPELEPILARHGITLRTDLLSDPERDLWESVGLKKPEPAERRKRAPESSFTDRLDDALDRLGAWADARAESDAARASPPSSR